MSQLILQLLLHCYNPSTTSTTNTTCKCSGTGTGRIGTKKVVPVIVVAHSKFKYKIVFLDTAAAQSCSFRNRTTYTGIKTTHNAHNGITGIKTTLITAN